MQLSFSRQAVYPWLAVLALSSPVFLTSVASAHAQDYYAFAAGNFTWNSLSLVLIVKMGLHLTLMAFVWRTAWKKQKKPAHLLMLFLALASAFNLSAFPDVTFLQTPQFGHLSSVSLALGGAMLVSALVFARVWLVGSTPVEKEETDETGLPLLGQPEQSSPIDDRLLLAWQIAEVSIGVGVLGTAFVWPQIASELLLWSWCGAIFAGGGVLAYLTSKGIKTAEMLLIGWAPALAGNLFAVSISGETTNTGIVLHGLSIIASLMAWAYYATMLVKPFASPVTFADSESVEVKAKPASSVVWELSPESLVPENKPRRLVDDIASATGSVFAWDVKSNSFTFSNRALALLKEARHTANHRFSGALSWSGKVNPIDRNLIEKVLSGQNDSLPSVITLDFRMSPDNDSGSERWLRLQASIFDNMDTIEQNENTQIYWGTLADVTVEKNSDSLSPVIPQSGDAVTGLMNRKMLLDKLKMILKPSGGLSSADGGASSGSERPNLLVVTLDVDEFSKINARFGYEGGDYVLTTIAHRLEALCTSQDLLARTGDDHLTVVKMHISSEKEASSFAQSILQTMRQPVILDGQELFIGVSLGLAKLEEGIQLASDLLTASETALAEAKPKLGRGRFALAKPKESGRSRHYDPLVLQSALYHALEKSEIIPYFQPIVRLKDRRIVGAEVLVRWNHSDYGLIPPEDFIPLAEKTGQIIPIGRFILAKTAEQLARWQAHQAKLLGDSYEKFFLSVNLSSYQLMHETLIPDLKTLFDVFKLPSRSLKIEITEHSLLDNQKKTVEIMEAARSLGASFGVDDFGKGYSSLSYLQNFPFQWLKIDRSIISRCHEDWSSRVVVRSIIDLGHELGMDVVAEGVENPNMLERLLVLGCDYVQGYVYGQPMPAHQFEQQLFAPTRQSLETQTSPMMAVPVSGLPLHDKQQVVDINDDEDDIKQDEKVVESAV